MFIITCFVAQFWPRLRANMLYDFFFYVTDKPPFQDIDVFDMFDEFFGPTGYEKDDFLYLTHVLKLDHFTDNFKFKYFDEVPLLIRKSVLRHAIIHCINYHLHKKPLPDYQAFIQKETGYYHIK